MTRDGIGSKCPMPRGLRITNGAVARSVRAPSTVRCWNSTAGRTPLSDTAYDRIAQWYDVDMARNMRFDDVAFYAELCQREGGRVLELGCGNGRVLLELVGRSIDAVGVDTSSK